MTPRKKRRETVWANQLVHTAIYLEQQEAKASHQSTEARDLYLARCLLGVVNELIHGKATEAFVRGYVAAMGWHPPYWPQTIDFKSRAAGERDDGT